MENTAVFIPVLLHFVLVITLYFGLLRTKSAAMRAKSVNLSDSKLNADAWPDSVKKVNNNIRNQFEVPMLFAALVFIVWALRLDDLPTLVLIWSFVISRYAHSYVHTRSNYVPVRMKLFSLGLLIIVLLMLRVGYAIIAG